MRTLPSAEFTPQSPWLDVVNSRMSDGFGHWTDHLGEPRWVTRFLRYWGSDADGLSPAAAVGELTALRGLLRKLTEKRAAGKSLTVQDIEALNALLRAPSYIRIVRRARSLATELRPARRGWGWIRARIVADFVDKVARDPTRIKVCANDACRWAFVDGTKSNVRRWCHDRRCGNRHRVRQSRARQRQPRPSRP